ncbi:hypothetical protein [Sphingomonas sp. CV7422]|uniref:hypothetical protein n=1 Tax=Sphingomonas sp. CV7422 TaxID=3018036 RepID=UPI0022FE3B7A|nr:hypothetical protein [Sphingomonas sp. CV7422]
MMSLRMTAAFGMIALLLAGCGSGGARDDAGETAAAAAPAPRPAGTSPAAASPAATAPAAAPAAAAETVSRPAAPRASPLACAAEIGTAAAAKRVAICRNVSPATHPPCNAVNSCAMIDDEIARSCALFDGKGAPIAGCTPAPKSPAAAAAVVRLYYAALNAGDYDTAWQQWGDGGKAGQTFAAFTRGFAQTRATQVTIGTLPPAEGAAGSLYQTVPVTVAATLADGRRQRFAGRYVVRRVNDVDGATPGKLRWHLDSAQLKPVG